MAISSISDVHVRNRDDFAYKLLISFLFSDEVVASRHVVLLGDIFDLMVGGHDEYRRRFPEFFERLETLLNEGKSIHYFEGNHDFHVEELFKGLGSKQGTMMIHRSPFVLEEFGKKILFAHGDEIQIGNWQYKAYRTFIRSYPLKLLASNLPFEIVDSIGKKASLASREKNMARYSGGSELERIKDLFRMSVEQAVKRFSSDLVIAGHSHVKDDYAFGEEKRYLNNGYVPLSRCFVHLTQRGQSLVNLELS